MSVDSLSDAVSNPHSDTKDSDDPSEVRIVRLVDEQPARSHATCALVCVLTSVLTLIAGFTGILISSKRLQLQNDHLNDPRYPECTPDMFQQKVLPLILDRSNVLSEQPSDDVDEFTEGNLLMALNDEIKHTFLVFGAIPEHETHRILISRGLRKKRKSIVVWMVDSRLLDQFGEDSTNRIKCLLQRAKETQHQYTRDQTTLVVILNHLSGHFKGEKHRDTGTLWKIISQFSHDHHSLQWKLFVVESDPSVIWKGNLKHIAREFSDHSVTTVCIPFSGGSLIRDALSFLVRQKSAPIRKKTLRSWNRSVAWYLSAEQERSVFERIKEMALDSFPTPLEISPKQFQKRLLSNYTDNPSVQSTLALSLIVHWQCFDASIPENQTSNARLTSQSNGPIQTDRSDSQPTHTLTVSVAIISAIIFTIAITFLCTADY